MFFSVWPDDCIAVAGNGEAGNVSAAVELLRGTVMRRRFHLP